MSATTTQPWYNSTDSKERNDRAKNAYTALLTITAKQPHDEEYIAFSDELKELALSEYNFSFTEDEPVSTFVTAFYDAVLLYAYALNDSIRDNGEDILTKPINGTQMTHLMWNRNFTGITGNVIIDSNGDRISEYTLLDMNPTTGLFEVTIFFYFFQIIKMFN